MAQPEYLIQISKDAFVNQVMKPVASWGGGYFRPGSGWLHQIGIINFEFQISRNTNNKTNCK